MEREGAFFTISQFSADLKTVHPLLGEGNSGTEHPFTLHHHLRFADLLVGGFDLDCAAAVTDHRATLIIGEHDHQHLTHLGIIHQMSRTLDAVDHFILEVPEPSLVSDLPDEDDLSRPEMEDAGFQVALIDEAGTTPNPLTNALSFRLEAWDAKKRRKLFGYGDWISYQHPMLVMMAQLIGLRVLYFDSQMDEFIPVINGRLGRDGLDSTPPPPPVWYTYIPWLTQGE